MERYGDWANPEDFSMVFRCMKMKYAKLFLSKGQIKFSTPNSWVEYSNSKSEGRGDKLEGTMATFHISDIENAMPLIKKYNRYDDLLRINDGQRVYFKKAQDMKLPCLCFYLLKHSMFDCPQIEGVHKLTALVPATYFRDFADNMSPEEIEKLDPNNKPAIVFINDYQKFEHRLVEFLMNIGLKREEIIIARIGYFDFEKYGPFGWWDFGQKPPMELCVKHIRFKNQSEGRIIINTVNTEALEILNNPIELGPLTDIASLSNKYLYEGMQIELTADVKKLVDH